MSLPTHCDAGCGRSFTVEEFNHIQLHSGIEKTSFACPHCSHEYVAFYTDDEIRRLQERIRKVQRRLASPHYDHAAQVKQEAKLKKRIKEKMDELKQRMLPHES